VSCDVSSSYGTCLTHWRYVEVARRRLPANCPVTWSLRNECAIALGVCSRVTRAIPLGRAVLNVYDVLAVNVIGALPAELRNVLEDFPIIVLPTTGRWTSLDDFEIQLLKICARQAVHVMRLL
jgi:hypothetical protein